MVRDLQVTEGAAEIAAAQAQHLARPLVHGQQLAGDIDHQDGVRRGVKSRLSQAGLLSQPVRRLTPIRHAVAKLQ